MSVLDGYRQGDRAFGHGLDLGQPRREDFRCEDCGEPHPYNQRRTASDAQRGRLTVCRGCKAARDVGARELLKKVDL